MSLRRVLAFLGIVWLLGAAWLPVVQDEAYYFAWAAHPALGYFDHPPFVALMAGMAPLSGGSALVARLGTLVVAALTVAATARFLRLCGLTRTKSPTESNSLLACGLLLAFGNWLGLALGILTTPDTGLMLAWVMALSEAALALQGRERRWLTAGLWTGLGLWAKYTMVLIGPVFLWALLAERRRCRAVGTGKPALARPWPYLGGVVGLLVVAPHLWWNAEHDWITARFQLRHGLATEHLRVGGEQGLPKAQKPAPGGPESLLAKPFKDLAHKEEKAERAPMFYDSALKALNRYVGYYTSQVALWGALAMVFVAAWRRRQQQPKPQSEQPTVAPAVLPLAHAAFAVPLIVFGLLSLTTKVEANWSAMYVFGACALLTPLVTDRPRAVWTGVLLNATAIAIAVLHAQTGILPTRPHHDRLLAETHGWPELASQLASLPGPIFADSYQITALARFYAPAHPIWQWPGITRDSEFVRTESAATGAAAQALATAGFFSLVTNDLPPPAIPGYTPRRLEQLRDCKGRALQVISSLAAGSDDQRCRQPIHEWYLVRYEASPALE